MRARIAASDTVRLSPVTEEELKEKRELILKEFQQIHLPVCKTVSDQLSVQI